MTFFSLVWTSWLKKFLLTSEFPGIVSVYINDQNKRLIYVNLTEVAGEGGPHLAPQKLLWTNQLS